jgi:hypothetical protein
MVQRKSLSCAYPSCKPNGSRSQGSSFVSVVLVDAIFAHRLCVSARRQAKFEFQKGYLNSRKILDAIDLPRHSTEKKVVNRFVVPTYFIQRKIQKKCFLIEFSKKKKQCISFSAEQ